MGLFEYIKQLLRELFSRIQRCFSFAYYPNTTRTSRVGARNSIGNAKNLYLGDNAALKTDSIIMNSRSKFIMKKNSGSAEELLVITGNHLSVVGMDVRHVTNSVKDKLDVNHEMDKDIIVDEDVWIGARVSLLSGVHIGRGCEIGTGAVLRSSVPPYSIVVGNPAKSSRFQVYP